MTRHPVFIALTVVAAFVAGCRSSEHEPTPQAPAVAVRTTAATLVDLAEGFDAGGVVAASESATIAARVLAPVQNVRIRAGDRVRAGDVLVTLDDRAASGQVRQAAAAAQGAEQAVIQAHGEHAAAVADHRLAAAWHGRIATLRGRNSATAQELDEADARLAAAAARVAAAGAAVDQATSRIDATRAAADIAVTSQSFTVIRAPFAGVVTERLVDPGALATPGAPLLRLDADGARRVDVRVDEARIGDVHAGDRVSIALGSATPAGEVEGTVVEVARAVAVEQRAFTVKVALPSGLAPRTGVYARARFRAESRRALVVPVGSVRREGQVASVFVVQEGVARLRLVRPGITDGDRIELVTGVDPGEVVVVDPPSGLSDGRRVTVQASGAGR